MATHQNYGSSTPGSEVAMEFSDYIKGRVVVLTGVSPDSIGQALAVNITKHQPERLILASRTASKMEAVAKTIRKEYPNASVDTVILDLSSQESVRKAAKTISKLVDRIDILINNAAVVDPKLHHTAEGIELQFGTGHIGHFLFTNLLMPLLEASAQKSEPGRTRIINVSSEGHRVSPIRFHDYNFEGKPIPDEELSKNSKSDEYSLWVSYGQSTSAHILFSVALTERLEKQEIRSYALHPGAIKTDLSRHMSAEEFSVIDNIVGGDWQPTDVGTSTILVAAFDPALNKVQSSIYLSNCQIVEAAPHATDPDIARRLWKLSEELTKPKTDTSTS